MKNVKIFLSAFAVILTTVFIIGCNAPVEEDNSPAAGGGGGAIVLPQGPAAVEFGIAGNFTVLASTAIISTGATEITGDVGITLPGTHAAITGFTLNPLDASAVFATSPLVLGGNRVYAANYQAPTPSTMASAKTAMINAYTDASTRLLPNFINVGVAGNIGGLIMAPGLYKFSGLSANVTIPTDITLNGAADDTWIIQVDGTLDMSTGVVMHLTGGAQAKNIVWVVAGAVTLTSTALLPTHIEGIVLGLTNISLTAGATVNGRLYAQTAVTLINNTVTRQ